MQGSRADCGSLQPVAAFGPKWSFVRSRFPRWSASRQALPGVASHRDGRNCMLSALDTRSWSRQSRVRSGRSASVGRSVLRPTALRCAVLRPRRATRCVRFALYARTSAPRMLTKRAARAAASPALLGAPQARCGLSARAFAEIWLARGLFGPPNTTSAASRQAASGGGDFWGAEEHSPGVGARSALRELTRRACPNEANAVSVVSCATRPPGAHRRAVGRSTDRPSMSPRRAPLGATRTDLRPGSDCQRDRCKHSTRQEAQARERTTAMSQRRRTIGMGRKRSVTRERGLPIGTRTR
jgi:hypothetical protein